VSPARPPGAGAHGDDPAALPRLAPTGAAPARRRIPASLRLDGVPELDPSVAERSAPYLAARSASFLGWDLATGGMLVATRLGDAAQVHRVETPGSRREQLTFQREPVTWAARDRADPAAGFYFKMDRGGGEQYQLHWQQHATGRARLLTDGVSRNDSPLPGRRGGGLAFTSTRRNSVDTDLWMLDGREASSARLMREMEGAWAVQDWAPDDGALLLRRHVSVTRSHVHHLDLASGRMTEIAPSHSDGVAFGDARFVNAHEVIYTSDEGSDFLRLRRRNLVTGEDRVLAGDLSWDVEDIALSRDGAKLAFVVNEGGRSTLHVASVGNEATARRIDLPTGVVAGVSFDPSGDRVGFTLSGPRSPGDAWSVDVATGEATRWTWSEVGGLDPASFVDPDFAEFPSFDGRLIPAWVYSPRQRASAPRPVLVVIHGGPEGQARPAFEPLRQFFVLELGLVLIEPNVRGSCGYGRACLRLDDGRLREDSVRDIGALLDYIGDRADLDASRVAVLGGSYGGYMALASLVHHGGRLRCGVDFVGISNFVTFLENTAAYRRDLRRVEYGDERDPDMRAFLESISPLRQADRIRVPLLVGQGANDPRVPRTEAEQIVRAVRAQGRAAWYVVADDEGHGFQKKPNRDAWHDIVTAFLEAHLLA
jgi:acetyl esterase/lipase